ncbi:GspE/PulE family protein [Anaerosporobacter faecicola]|uniref:GspE/PulE family protein n=1 Tax=Anaerosporobacter faecicola TaxID=2718714 RepID=UPI001439F15D|nr:ATPase, T2SS/T4P/T4SS family [Anaerosporobacter faecicola]
MEKIDRTKKRLGDLLVLDQAITEEQLKSALQEQKNLGGKIGEVLIDLGYTTDRDIARALHRQLGLEIVTLSDVEIDEKIINLVDESLLRKYSVIPFDFSKSSGNILRLAMVDPMNFTAIDDISIVSNCQIEPVVSTLREISLAIDKYYGNKETLAVVKKYTEEKKTVFEEKELTENSDILNSPIVVLANSIIEQAVRQRASDIHIEALERKIRVRYRIDGVLKEVMSFQVNMLSALITRIKIMSNMDISEKRKPQDGRISKVVDRQEFDIRVSALPTVFGEKIVMRLTPKQGVAKDKRELGFTGKEVKQFDKMLSHTHGIILVTGPTGSGKSTTLCSALTELNREEVNIVTVEDPVEANLDGVNQVNVNVKAGLTFASALRSILRQDPDIIMIGEIRDSETAQIAVKASITGHLVVSTLHTNNAASSITRLVDMGVESYLIADSVVGVIAQRLVRRLCTQCRIPYEASAEEKKLLHYDKEEKLTLYRPCGCQHCSETGYRGRIGIYEIMNISSELKEIIVENKSSEEIEQCALDHGMDTLYISATRKVIDGITSIEEMKRVIYEDD